MLLLFYYKTLHGCYFSLEMLFPAEFSENLIITTITKFLCNFQRISHAKKNTFIKKYLINQKAIKVLADLRKYITVFALRCFVVKGIE